MAYVWPADRKRGRLFNQLVGFSPVYGRSPIIGWLLVFKFHYKFSPAILQFLTTETISRNTVAHYVRSISIYLNCVRGDLAFLRKGVQLLKGGIPKARGGGACPLPCLLIKNIRVVEYYF